MKTFVIISVIFFASFGSAFSQEQQNNANKKQEHVQDDTLGNLLESFSFQFIATRAFPTSGKPVNLSGDSYSVTFSPEEVVSTLPFFGRAFSPIAMDEDTGMRFKGKPINISFKKEGSYLINAVVKDGDTYRISLSVGKNGFARLTISSGQRDVISYQGEITRIVED